MFNDEDSHKFKSRVDLSKSRQVNAEDAIRYERLEFKLIHLIFETNFVFPFRRKSTNKFRFDKYVGKQADELI